jgi:hypothetical protein
MVLTGGNLLSPVPGAVFGIQAYDVYIFSPAAVTLVSRLGKGLRKRDPSEPQ